MSHSNHVSNKFLLAFYGLEVIFYLLRQLKVSVADFFCVHLIIVLLFEVLFFLCNN